jgi:predicted RNA-binding Zn-ribbon protein involved in translation (DUF1610 family)
VRIWNTHIPKSTRVDVMPKCPKCGAEIEFLKHYESGEMSSHYVDGEDTNEIFIADYKTVEYECPECSEVLFKHESDAEEFLLGNTGNNTKKGKK